MVHSCHTQYTQRLVGGSDALISLKTVDVIVPKSHKINTTWRSQISYATLSRSPFIQQSYEILSLLGNVEYMEEITIFSQ